MLSFKGELRPIPYTLASLALFFSQHLAVLAIFWLQDLSPDLDWLFYVSPLHSLEKVYGASQLLLVLGFVYFVIVAWALAALSFRRATNAGGSGWIAAWVI